MDQQRHPRGTPNGGQFAADTRPETSQSLASGQTGHRPVPAITRGRSPAEPVVTPYTPYELGQLVDDDGYLDAYTSVDFDSVVMHGDVGEFSDTLSDQVVGDATLSGVDYEPVAIEQATGRVVLRVRGDAKRQLDEWQEDDVEAWSEFQAGRAVARDSSPPM